MVETWFKALLPSPDSPLFTAVPNSFRAPAQLVASVGGPGVDEDEGKTTRFGDRNQELDVLLGRVRWLVSHPGGNVG